MTLVGLTQRVSVIEEYGERRDCLDQAWTTLLTDLGCTPLPLPNEIDDVPAYLDELALDAVILTSGNDLPSVDEPDTPAPERDRFERATLEYAIERDIPVLGVCRGLELIYEYFGGELTTVPADEHVATTHPLEVDHDVVECHFPNCSIPEDLTVNSYHDYACAPPAPEPLAPLATAPDGTIEFVAHHDHPIYGIMWHPERESPSATLDRQLLTSVLG